MRKFPGFSILVPAILLVGVPGAVMARQDASIGHADALAYTQLASTSARLAVTSPAFADGGPIPLSATQYGANRFPGLVWTMGPPATASYVVIVQGEATGSAANGGTSIHLVVLNLPARSTALPAGLTTAPPGAALGLNVHGPHQPYSGPHTHTQQRHAYHFQVFALDHTLPTGLGDDFPALEAAMRGHVLATGQVVGLAGEPAGTSPALSAAPAHTQLGQLSGVPGRNPAITVYKGVPYAAAPIGPLRWRPPGPPPSWPGVRKADRFGAACPQAVPPDQPPMRMDEDCLTLNIWTGATAATEHRPVLVWIYGGGFIAGSGAQPLFDGEGLAAKGIVVVTFNYRLGVLGFLATPALSAESGHGASGNYGLLDDIAVLAWVHRNIAAFGGDPARVTIAGQSAGAGSVGLLSMSPLANGLFTRSIAESHVRYPRDPDLRYLSVSYRTLAHAEAGGARYAATHGASTPAQLRAMAWQALLPGSDTVDASVQTGSTGKPPLFRPVVDGWVIPRGYTQTFARHAQNNVEFLAGSNLDEEGAVPATAFAHLRARSGPPRAGLPQSSVRLTDFIAAAKVKFGAMAPEFLTLYPARNDDEAALQNNAAARDGSRISTWLWAAAWTAGSTHRAYTYFWTHAPPGPSHDLRGAYHGSEINYVFGNLSATGLPWTSQDHSIADRMSSYWANYIATGDPNAPNLPHWQPFAADRATTMSLGDSWGPIPIARAAKIAFWKRFFAAQAPW